MTIRSLYAAQAQHPRLYFTPEEQTGLRSQRASGVHAQIWKNMAESADWCLTRTPRGKWIAPIANDPIYENLYDRFYGMMHDMAVMEHLAFAYAYSGDRRYFQAGRDWMLACARVWGHEAEGEADASKAYAVTRLLKGLAVSYDLLYDRLSDADRTEIRATMVAIGGKYYQWYLQNPTMGTMAQGAHHASVETASFGVTALALLDEAPEAKDWLDLMVKKHTESLLPEAILASGAQAEGQTFWASTMQYRLFFMDALRRVTGRNLFREFQPQMDGRFALAALVAPKRGDYDEDHETALLQPSYGQLNYYSSVLLCLAREYRRPTYQHLALWDGSVGAIQKTRYITNHGEQMLFDFGGYAYAWYDPSVPVQIEKDLPLSFEFAEINEAYLRASYETGAIGVGMTRGRVVAHAGGQAVFIEQYDLFPLPQMVKDVLLVDSKTNVVLRCTGAADSAFTEQTIDLTRPGLLTIRRKTGQGVRWWCQGDPKRDGNTLRWLSGTILRVRKGSIESFVPDGYCSHKIVGMGKLDLTRFDPMPRKYPLVAAKPEGGELIIEVQSK